MVRLGLACNALNASMRAALDAPKRAGIITQNADAFAALVWAASAAHEVIVLTNQEIRTLTRFARDGRAPEEIHRQMALLRGGSHPACAFLARARNKLGAHWDPPLLLESVQQFAGTDRIVWIESDSDDHITCSFAFYVLFHALYPSANARDLEGFRDLFRETTTHISDAIETLNRFCEHCQMGYLATYGADRMRGGA
jgi:hypothetical protein